MIVFEVVKGYSLMSLIFKGLPNRKEVPINITFPYEVDDLTREIRVSEWDYCRDAFPW